MVVELGSLLIEGGSLVEMFTQLLLPCSTLDWPPVGGLAFGFALASD